MWFHAQLWYPKIKQTETIAGNIYPVVRRLMLLLKELFYHIVLYKIRATPNHTNMFRGVRPAGPPSAATG